MAERYDLVTTDEGSAARPNTCATGISRAQKCIAHPVETHCIAATKNLSALGAELLTEAGHERTKEMINNWRKFSIIRKKVNSFK